MKTTTTGTIRGMIGNEDVTNSTDEAEIEIIVIGTIVSITVFMIDSAIILIEDQ